MKNNMKSLIGGQQLKQLEFLNNQLKCQEFKRQEFSTREINLMEAFCKELGYILSINNQKKTAKIFNKATHRFGFIQKTENTLFYGYFKKDSFNNSEFVAKYDLQSNFDVFGVFMRQLGEVKKNFRNLCGIIELEVNGVRA